MTAGKTGRENLRKIDYWRTGIVSFYSVLILFFGFIVPGFGHTNEYPKKPIVWIVPYQPGGGYDAYSRAIAKILPKNLPQRVKVVVKNVVGAGGRRGSVALYRSKPDGYTIGLLNLIGLLSSDLVKKSTQYDLDKYTYLATCSRGIPGVFVAGASNFNSIEDLRKEKRIRFATGGQGSGTWLWGMLVKGILDIPVSMISGYLGISDYVTAIIRKDAEAIIVGFSSSVIPYCRAGELKPILFIAKEPLEWMPDVPTARGTSFEELVKLTNDRAIAAPPDLPVEIARILEDSILRALNDPEFIEWSVRTGNPLTVIGSMGTRKSIQMSRDFMKKYEKFLKD